MTTGHAPGNRFGSARAPLETAQGSVTYFRMDSLVDAGVVADRDSLERLPMTIKILLENLLRNAGNGVVRDAEVEAMAQWKHAIQEEGEFPFYPARVLLQDFTGVPCAVDLAAMRSAMARLGGDPKRINPLLPAHLVIDHSVQVDDFGSAGAFVLIVVRESERNADHDT